VTAVRGGGAHVADLAQRGGCDLGNVGPTELGDLRGVGELDGAVAGAGQELLNTRQRSWQPYRQLLTRPAPGPAVIVGATITERVQDVHPIVPVPDRTRMRFRPARSYRGWGLCELLELPSKGGGASFSLTFPRPG
jgi:hypothetical protein